MFEGEDGLETKEGEESKGSFSSASVWGRISTVFAGPFFNFILAFVIAIIMVNLIVIREPIASDVVAGSAAQEAGLQAGDRIISLDGERIYLYEELVLFTYTHQGGEIELAYERDGEHYTTRLTPQYDEGTNRYMLGITNQDFVKVKGLESLKFAWYEVRYCVKNTYKSLSMLVQGQVDRQDVAGPVGIATNLVGKTYENAKQYGGMEVFVNMLNITLMLSINLGIINLLPLPALDGGRLVFLLLEVVRGKPVPPEKEGIVHFVGLMFFMVLSVFILFNDISNIFM